MSTNNNIEVLSVSAKLTKTFSAELANIQDALIDNLDKQLGLLKQVRGLEKQINATHVFIDGYVNSQKQEEVKEMTEKFEEHTTTETGSYQEFKQQMFADQTFPEKLEPVLVDSGIQPEEQEKLLDDFEKGELTDTTNDNVFTQPEAEQYPQGKKPNLPGNEDFNPYLDANGDPYPDIDEWDGKGRWNY